MLLLLVLWRTENSQRRHSNMLLKQVGPECGTVKVVTCIVLCQGITFEQTRVAI